MCRLYGFQSTELTKVECTLVHAQNALLSQSLRDMSGSKNADGWGVGAYVGSEPMVERQAWAAYHGEQFRKAASRVYSTTVLAHVRSATVGKPSLQNTHPFLHGRQLFAHNGTVEAFEEIRPGLLEEVGPEHREEIHGTTDSELIFHLLLCLKERNPERSFLETLRTGIGRVLSLSREAAPRSEASLNVLWTDGKQMVGSRFGRSLWYVEREGVHDCEICGFPHVRHDTRTPYRAVVVASEPITHETWIQFPEESIFSIDERRQLRVEPLRRE